jgi:rhamnosyl/mannosyltransferase
MKTKKRIKVLQVGKFYPPYRGGMETHLETLCKELQKTIDVQVLVSNSERETTKETVEGIPVTRLGTKLKLGSTSFTPALAAHIAETDADLIHLHLPNPWAVTAYLASQSKAPIVVTHHSDIVRQRVLGAMYSPIQEILMKRCSAVIVSSPNAIDHSPTLRRHRSLCWVVPFGVSEESFAVPDIDIVQSLRRQHGSNLILSVGRLVYYKGIEYLIQAMKSVPGKLLLVGQGPLERSLKTLAATQGVMDRVTFLGNVSPEILRALYHAADVFVLSSVAKSEAFGMVQVEAMAASRPVVNTKLPSGVPFVSRNGETGRTVLPKNASALAQAINELLADDQLRSRYGQAARHRADTLFTAEAMTADTLEVYRSVLERGGSHVHLAA